MAKALAREIASRVIRTAPALWDELKQQLRGGRDVDCYGGGMQTAVFGAVNRAVAGLTDTERSLLNEHVTPPRDAIKGWSFSDHIVGEIFTRAKRAAARS